MTIAALEYRLSTLGSLLSVVEALRSLAAAKQQRAAGMLEAAGAYATTSAAALAALCPEPSTSSSRLFLLLGPEGGFTGGLPGRLVAALPGDVRPLVVGSRTIAAAQARHVPLAGTLPAPAMADALPPLAASLCAKFPADAAITILHPRDHAFIQTDLPPLPRQAGRVELLTQLPASALLTSAGMQDRQARLLLALLQTHAAEQLARLSTLTGARERIRDRVSELTIQLSTARQDSISQEIADLWSGRRALMG